MDSTLVPIKIPRSQSTYDITIGRGSLAKSGSWAAKTLGRESGRRLLIVSNRKVFGLYGATVSKSLIEAGFVVHVHLIGDGEPWKNFRTLERVLRALSVNGFTRTDTVVPLGGGVVGDLASFAASIHLRGIRLLQIPTTLLAMIDSSVGGKTAINSSFGKNLIGSFYQPDGVLIDIETLQTLPRRELTAGFCEVIKQGAVSGRRLFRQTVRFLETYDPDNFRRDSVNKEFSKDLTTLVADQIKFKAKIVQNDETESPADTTSRSRKVLNFGHTLAHALEKATNYKYLRHGEAVGYGMIFAARLSKRLELLGQDEVNLLNDVVHRVGVLPAISHIDQSKILESLKYDKKRVGNSLHWVLLRDIGKPVIIPDTQIPTSAITSTLKAFLQK